MTFGGDTGEEFAAGNQLEGDEGRATPEGRRRVRPRRPPHPPKDRNRLRDRQLDSADALQLRSGTDQVQVDLVADAEGEWAAVRIPERHSARAWWIGRPENHRTPSQLLPRAHQPDNLPLVKNT